MARKDPNPDSEGFRGVSDAELRVLKCLWSDGAANPNGLREALQEDGTDWAYTTVQTLLHRLLKKGFVTRRKEGVAQIYTAAVDQEELLAAHMDDLADRLCEGAATPLLLSLVRSGRVNKKDLARFRKMIDEAEGK